MTWKLMVGVLVMPYVVMVYMTATMSLQSDITLLPSDSQAVFNFLNAAGQPHEVNINQPTIGNGVPITMTQVYPTNPAGWMGFVARSITMTGPMWEPWTVPIRWFIGSMAFVAALFLTMMAWQTFGFLIAGVAGAVGAGVLAAGP